jgi:hypothetical protein
VLVDCFAADHDADVTAAMQSVEVRPAARATCDTTSCAMWSLVLGSSRLPLRQAAFVQLTASIEAALCKCVRAHRASCIVFFRHNQYL